MKKLQQLKQELKPDTVCRYCSGLHSPLQWHINLGVCVCICRTVYILSEALDEQLKTLWFSPFQTDDIETDLEMVSVFVILLFVA